MYWEWKGSPQRSGGHQGADNRGDHRPAVTNASGVQGLAGAIRLRFGFVAVWILCDVYENDLATCSGRDGGLRLNAYPTKH